MPNQAVQRVRLRSIDDLVVRTTYSIVPLLTAMFLADCAYHRGESLSWNGRTILPGGESVASLNHLVNDSARSRDDRARAVFTLFAHHIRPGCSAEELRKVFTNLGWLAKAEITGIRALGGWIPVGLRDAFALSPFVDGEGRSEWVIYMRFSFTKRRQKDEVLAFLRHHAMPEDERSLSIALDHLSAQEALAFLKGDSSLAGRPRLLEFALCFPSTSQSHGRLGRIERFGVRGIHIYEQQ